MYNPIRGGTRGGQGDFKWSDVKDDEQRENYLGHSINAPKGRWQNGKDITWYLKDKQGDEDERAEEIRKIKEAEEDALSAALGFAPTPRAPPPPPVDENAVVLAEAAKAAEKERRRKEKDERKAARATKRAEREERGHKSSRRHRDEDERGGKERERDRDGGRREREYDDRYQRRDSRDYQSSSRREYSRDDHMKLKPYICKDPHCQRDFARSDALSKRGAVGISRLPRDATPIDEEEFVPDDDVPFAVTVAPPAPLSETAKADWRATQAAGERHWRRLDFPRKAAEGKKFVDEDLSSDDDDESKKVVASVEDTSHEGGDAPRNEEPRVSGGDEMGFEGDEQVEQLNEEEQFATFSNFDYVPRFEPRWELAPLPVPSRLDTPPSPERPESHFAIPYPSSFETHAAYFSTQSSSEYSVFPSPLNAEYFSPQAYDDSTSPAPSSYDHRVDHAAPGYQQHVVEHGLRRSDSIDSFSSGYTFFAESEYAPASPPNQLAPDVYSPISSPQWDQSQFQPSVQYGQYEHIPAWQYSTEHQTQQHHCTADCQCMLHGSGSHYEDIQAVGGMY
ncbi:hypothetical protein MNV49_000622 [Pseudohyphozyma bogoriensis]|nr:hypothetical protein MNV49_000622 [Pseudohyphozyma bogoriensis]